MALNLHLVRLFVAVATERSFSRAAITLHISQPAVSKGVAALERQVGMTLVDRSQAHLPLTEAGQTLLRHAQGLFASERAAEMALMQLRDLAQGQLAIGASTTIGNYLLPPIVAAFHRHYPAIRLTLQIGNTRDLVQMLLAAPLDLMLVEGPVADESLRVTPWQSDRLVVIAAAHHPLRHQHQIPAVAVTQGLVVLRETGSGTRETIDAQMVAQGLSFTHIMEVGHTEAIKHLVAAGLGLGIVPAVACQEDVVLGRLVVLDVPNLTFQRQLWQVVVAERPQSPAMQAFAALLTG
jgi:DNA-binding transcriptional LysR family regulator